MYRRIQTEYRAPSIRITRHNEHESLRSSSESSKPVIDKSRQGLFSRFPHLSAQDMDVDRRRGQREATRNYTSSRYFLIQRNGGLWTAKYNDESSSIAVWQCSSPPPVDTGSFLAIRCVPRWEEGREEERRGEFEGGNASKNVYISRGPRDEMSNARIERREKSLWGRGREGEGARFHWLTAGTSRAGESTASGLGETTN